ncbi:MAG: hypothetical protein QOB17_04740, partial [Nitrososphaeraceae archaeon]|nr:hypothetical protein [Nitrososphaeraceae archaeon]
LPDAPVRLPDAPVRLPDAPVRLPDAPVRLPDAPVTLLDSTVPFNIGDDCPLAKGKEARLEKITNKTMNR